MLLSLRKIYIFLVLKFYFSVSCSCSCDFLCYKKFELLDLDLTSTHS